MSSITATASAETDDPGMLLPPEVAAKTGAVFGRARSYPIFSVNWFRYRSMSFLVGTLIVYMVILALLGGPAMRSTTVVFSWSQLFGVSAAYMVPLWFLILAGPGLVVLLRRESMSRAGEGIAMLLVLMAGAVVSFIMFFSGIAIYAEKTFDMKTDALMVDSLPFVSVKVNIRQGPELRFTGLRDVPRHHQQPDAKLLEAERQLRSAFAIPEDGQVAWLKPKERAAVAAMKRLDAGDPTIGPAERKAIETAYTDTMHYLYYRYRSDDPTLKFKLTEHQKSVARHYHSLLNKAERDRRVSNIDDHLARRMNRLADLTVALAGLLVLLWLGGFFDLATYVRQRRRLTRVLEKQELQREQAARTTAEMRLSVLAAQVEPHFLFNTLASVRSAINTDPQRATHIVDQMVNYLRSTIPQMRGDAICHSVRLASQLDTARSYLALMHERIPRLQFAVDADPSLDNASIPPLMLISLVENAVKHGVEPKIGPVRVDVRAHRIETDDGPVLEVSVSDDGVGFGSTVSGGGLGLSNIQERLRSHFGQRASLTLKALPDGGVSAILRFPLTFEP